MDSVKGLIKPIPEKAPQPEVPNKLMKDCPTCIYRASDALAYKKHLAEMENRLGVVERIKRKLGNLFNHD